MKPYLEQVIIEGDIYQVDMLPITPEYDEWWYCPSMLVVETLLGGDHWIMQVDNIHDVDQDNQYNITATSNEHHARVLGVPLLPKP